MKLGRQLVDPMLPILSIISIYPSYEPFRMFIIPKIEIERKTNLPISLIVQDFLALFPTLHRWRICLLLRFIPAIQIFSPQILLDFKISLRCNEWEMCIYRVPLEVVWESSKD